MRLEYEETGFRVGYTKDELESFAMVDSLFDLPDAYIEETEERIINFVIDVFMDRYPDEFEENDDGTITCDEETQAIVARTCLEIRKIVLEDIIKNIRRVKEKAYDFN